MPHTGLIYCVFIGIMGGLARIIYDEMGGKTHNRKDWFYTLFLGGIVGGGICDILPVNYLYRNIIIVISGLSSKEIIGVIIAVVPEELKRRLMQEDKKDEEEKK